MTVNQVLAGVPAYFSANVPQVALNIINNIECRVENFFVINLGIYLESLVNNGDIISYSIQNHIPLPVGRVHVDIKIVDSFNQIGYVEVKHFAVEPARPFRFYTSNTTQGIRVGIIKDFIKLDNLMALNLLPPQSTLYCCAFVTPNVILTHQATMLQRFAGYPTTQGWILQPHASQQNPLLGFMYFEK